MGKKELSGSIDCQVAGTFWSEYKEELYLAVKSFIRYNMTADVYNLPLCLADKRIWEFCKDSISTWKKSYLKQCENCTKKDICSGVFETSFTHSGNIAPVA